MMGKDIKVWAHRGASGYAPENTMEAYRLAQRMGADGIELDVQLSKDGELVVIHDEKLSRTSDGKGWVKDYTLEELRKFNYNRTKPDYRHADIPTLREVLVYIRDCTRMSVNIELKTGIIFYEGIEEKTLRLVKELGLSDIRPEGKIPQAESGRAQEQEARIIYSSFNHYSIMKIREINPKAMTGLLYEDGFIGVPEYGARLGADALHPLYKNLRYPHFMEECAGYGLELNVWTVNDEEDIRRMYEAGVHAVITNYPDRAVRVREEYLRECGSLC
mgnify:CR=1 FL=1